jgi:NUDIX domain
MSLNRTRPIQSMDVKRRIVLEVQQYYKSVRSMTVEVACMKAGIYSELFHSYKKALQENNDCKKKRMHSKTEQQEKIQQIHLDIANGYSKAVAYKRANISRSTYKNWIRKYPSIGFIDANEHNETTHNANPESNNNIQDNHCTAMEEDTVGTHDIANFDDHIGMATQEEVEVAAALANLDDVHESNPSPPIGLIAWQGRSHTSVITNNLQEMINSCSARSYKVHRPKCTCCQMQQVLLLLQLEPLDGLVVIPNTKGEISIIYLCPNTGEVEFQRDSLGMEKKLASEIFASAQTIRATCAQCVLENNPNAFVCVASSVRNDVNWACDWARKVHEEKLQAAYYGSQGTGPHSDHFKHICSLSFESISDLFLAQNDQHLLNTATEAVINQLKEQNIPVDGVGQSIEMKYQLIGLIKSIYPNDAVKYKYWLVGIHDIGTEGGKKWAINIPGGKRHLGETTWECAEREMFEETSLPICSRWVREERRNNQDMVNMYYFIRHY